jgi:thiol-disulfide isomerase/thioredoxin
LIQSLPQVLKLALGTTALVALALNSFAQDKPAVPSLRVGDPAPPIKVGAWLKGEPVASFEKDRVYVVEFWATWCVPCKKSIPHLSAIQEKFAARGVTLLAVSVWEDDQKRVKPFVDELGAAMGYRVAMDLVPPRAKPGLGQMALLWLRAAGEDYLPTAFIVDGGGRVAWIGTSLEIDAPLESVVAGTWDLELARAKNEQRIKVNLLVRRLRELLPMKAAAQAKTDWNLALSIMDELLALDPTKEYETAPYRFNSLLQLAREDEAYAYARKLVDGKYKDDAIKLNLLAWYIVDPDAPHAPRRDLALALQLAKRADDLTAHKNSAIIDTLAVVYFESGDTAKALELQEQAVKLAVGTGFYAELNKRLEQYRAAQKQLTPPPEANRRSDG